MSNSIVNIGPALVDLVANLPEGDIRYERSLELLGAEPGMYVPLEDEKQLAELLGILIGSRDPFATDLPERVRHATGCDLIAGSTGLGFLAAMRPQQRHSATIVTTIGSESGASSPIADIYTADAERLGITHHRIIKAGSHPLGITISSANNPDKVLSMHPGVAFDLDTIGALQPDIIHVDAYELLEGSIAGLIHDLITSGSYKISLGLGNKSILDARLVSQILGYIATGKLEFVLGNLDEWSQLTGLVYSDLREVELIPLATQIPNLLITDGEKGLAAISNQHFVYQPAEQQQQVINTAGSGDTAAGVFVSGLLDNKPLDQILAEAAHWAGHVTSIEHTKLPNGREA